MIGPLVQWFLKQRFLQVEQWKLNPMDAQQKVFRDLISAAKATEWGKQYNYASIQSFNDYRNRFPLQDYETLKPYIFRIMQGEQNILVPSPVKWFSKSSGTTGDKSKFIPMNYESIEECHYKGGIDLIAAYCVANPGTRLLSAKGVIVGGSHQPNNGSNSVSTGDLSAVLMQNMSVFAQWFRIPDLQIALMSDWEVKIDAMAKAIMNENVSNISGVPTWTLLLLKRVLELKGKNTICEVWPNFELYIHGGVSFTPYRNEFRKLIGSDQNYFYQSYNATEGFFAFQEQPDDDDMLLHLSNGIFYEFIPSSEFGKEHPATVLLDEVRTDENYGLVISTNGGLWRYVVGDTIRFTSLRPFKIQVTGRLKHFINVFGEEVIVDNTDRAIATACAQTGAVVSDYTVAPVFLTTQTKGGHQWLIEFTIPPADLTAFACLLDQTLQSLNSDYEAKRQGELAMQLPIVNAVPHHTFYNWLKSKNKLGGQNKVPRLSNDRILLEEILAVL